MLVIFLAVTLAYFLRFVEWILIAAGPSRLRRSLARSRAGRFARRNRRACPQARILKSVFTWRHGGHIGVPKQWNGSHVGVPNQSCGSWILFLCKCFFISINLHRCWPREWKHCWKMSVSCNRQFSLANFTRRTFHEPNLMHALNYSWTSSQRPPWEQTKLYGQSAKKAAVVERWP